MFRTICMRNPNPRSRGFSLVEILVVITIMALLVTSVTVVGGNMIDSAQSTECKKQLKDIAGCMVLLKKSRKDRGMNVWPHYKGIRFLLELTKGGKHALVTGKKTEVFLCPGTDDVNTLEEDSTPGAAYANLDDLDTFSISYAGRNQVDYPIAKDEAGTDAILAADDNEERANHKQDTNYVTIDATPGSVSILDFMDEYPEMEFLKVGPESPYEPFTKLLIDY